MEISLLVRLRSKFEATKFPNQAYFLKTTAQPEFYLLSYQKDAHYIPQYSKLSSLFQIFLQQKENWFWSVRVLLNLDFKWADHIHHNFLSGDRVAMDG